MENKRAIFITATDYRGLNLRSQLVSLVPCTRQYQRLWISFLLIPSLLPVCGWRYKQR